MEKLFKGAKKLLFQHILTKQDLSEIGKAYMNSKGIDITDGEESLTIVVHKRSREESSEDVE